MNSEHVRSFSAKHEIMLARIRYEAAQQLDSQSAKPRAVSIDVHTCSRRIILDPTAQHAVRARFGQGGRPLWLMPILFFSPPVLCLVLGGFGRVNFARSRRRD